MDSLLVNKLGIDITCNILNIICQLLKPTSKQFSGQLNLCCLNVWLLDDCWTIWQRTTCHVLHDLHGLHFRLSMRKVSIMAYNNFLPHSSTCKNRYRFIFASVLKLHRLHSKCGELSFSYSGPAAWNALPTNICTDSNFTAFKRLQKTHLLTVA